jgi:hypothetical protein
MAQTAPDAASGRRIRLNRDRVLRAAVALTDDAGIDSLSMRHFAQALGVVRMALGSVRSGSGSNRRIAGPAPADASPTTRKPSAARTRRAIDRKDA